VERLARDAVEAAELRAYQTHPDVVALRVEQVRTQVDRLCWAGIMLGLAFTMTNVQQLAAAGARPWSLPCPSGLQPFQRPPAAHHRPRDLRLPQPTPTVELHDRKNEKPRLPTHRRPDKEVELDELKDDDATVALGGE
jgi:hypothetical protein